MPRKMSAKISGFALTIGAVIAALAVTLAPPSVAASRHRHHAVAVHRVHRVYATHSRRRVARRPAAAVRPGVAPGYVFVPGRGILGEACDMPTSTCSNQYRDVQ